MAIGKWHCVKNCYLKLTEYKIQILFPTDFTTNGSLMLIRSRHFSKPRIMPKKATRISNEIGQSLFREQYRVWSFGPSDFWGSGRKPWNNRRAAPVASCGVPLFAGWILQTQSVVGTSVYLWRQCCIVYNPQLFVMLVFILDCNSHFLVNMSSTPYISQYLLYHLQRQRSFDCT